MHPLAHQGTVKCQGCGKKIVWMGMYGDWCSTCLPRDTDPEKVRK